MFIFFDVFALFYTEIWLPKIWLVSILMFWTKIEPTRFFFV
jgi:hypothetical protein